MDCIHHSLHWKAFSIVCLSFYINGFWKIRAYWYPWDSPHSMGFNVGLGTSSLHVCTLFCGVSLVVPHLCICSWSSSEAICKCAEPRSPAWARKQTCASGRDRTAQLLPVFILCISPDITCHLTSSTLMLSGLQPHPVQPLPLKFTPSFPSCSCFCSYFLLTSCHTSVLPMLESKTPDKHHWHLLPWAQDSWG